MLESNRKNNYHKKCHLLNIVTKLDVRLIDNEGNAIHQLVNHFIPTVLQSTLNRFLHVNDTLRKSESNHYFRYKNADGLEYIAAGIYAEDHSYHGCIIIGPFISSLFEIEVIRDIIYENQLPISERKKLEGFYQSLSVLSSSEMKGIGELLVNICIHEHIGAIPITTEIIKPALNQEKLQMNIEESKNVIESRYQYEKELMNAISKGNKDQALALFTTDAKSIFNFSDRVPESPIRSAKNMILVLNTLCRLAAEKGGVHPLYIDNISERFAILIERSPNLPHLQKLSGLMVNEYCDIVSVYSTSPYSQIVKKAVDYIHLNLGSSLSLAKIADEIHVNASYLSRKFKSETKMSMIDYINQKRVEEAKLYLQRGNMSITDIAFIVGFNDLNYFSRVFKKFTSLTPSQYMKRKA